MKTKRPPGYGTVYKRRRIWWICPPGGKHESSHSTRRSDAEKLLDRRLEEMRVATVLPSACRATYDDLEKLLVNDMRANGRTSLYSVEKSILPRLRAVFAGLPARRIDYALVSAYIARRLPDAAAATVSYEVKLLGRMFRLGLRAGVVDRLPAFPTVSVGDNARRGFCSRAEIERVISHLADHAKPVVWALYLTGWRTNEILRLEWRNVDFEAKTIRLAAEESKTRRPRVFPFDKYPELAALLKERRRITKALEREREQIIQRVFHLHGEPVESIRTTWHTAVKKAGLPGLRPHDLRRSAARNLVRAGVPEKVVMDLCGWRTRAMFDRYNITAMEDLTAAGEKLSEFLNRKPKENQEAANEG